MERRDVGPTRVEGVADAVHPLGEGHHRRALVGVYLELDLARGAVLEREPPVHLGEFAHLRADLEAQVAAQRGEALHHVADAAGAGAHEVEVLAVAVGLGQEQLVEGGAAPEHQLAAQQGIVRYFDHGHREQEVLLDLVLVLPGVVDAPLGYVGPAHHMSGSTSSFTMILHFASSLPVLADAGERKDGSLASVAQ